MFLSDRKHRLSTVLSTKCMLCGVSFFYTLWSFLSWPSMKMLCFAVGPAGCQQTEIKDVSHWKYFCTIFNLCFIFFRIPASIRHVHTCSCGANCEWLVYRFCLLNNLVHELNIAVFSRHNVRLYIMDAHSSRQFYNHQSLSNVQGIFSKNLSFGCELLYLAKFIFLLRGRKKAGNFSVLKLRLDFRNLAFKALKEICEEICNSKRTS